MPFTSGFPHCAGLATALSLCLLCACTTTGGPAPPAYSAVDHARIDPAREASDRLLREAHRAYVHERYPAAAQFFQRFLEDFPDAPRSPEARWWLGRSLEQTGDLGAAIDQYRRLAAVQGGLPSDAYRTHARRRLEDLRLAGVGDGAGASRRIAVQMSVEQLPFPALREEWLRAVKQAGVTSVVVDATFFAGAVVEASRLPAWTSLASDAHRLGLQVWLSFNVHEGNGLPLRPEWMTLTVAGDGSDTSAPRPDVTHPGYQMYLEEIVKGFVSSGCDGIFLSSREASGYASEYSESSFRVFSEAFGVSLTPRELVRAGPPEETGTVSRTSEYWRWVGWKAARYAGLAGSLRRSLGQINPLATVLVELHRSAVESPVRALEEYGEDVAELVRSGAALILQRDATDNDTLVDRLLLQARISDRVWVRRSVASPLLPADVFRRMLLDIRERSRWNVLVDSPGAAPIP